VIHFAVAGYRERLRGEASVEQQVQSVAALDACLAALEYVDRNANLALVIQQWSDQLADPLAGQPLITAH
jgi:hypothetical protein